MLASYPGAWLLLTLPFLSSILIRCVPALLTLASRRNRTMRVIGFAGLATMLIALVGGMHREIGFPLMVLGGVLSGFTVFTLQRPGGGDDWRGWRRPPDDSDPPPPAGGPLDWERFDRMRAEWERVPVAG
jgi:hypothetical protein